MPGFPWGASYFWISLNLSLKPSTSAFSDTICCLYSFSLATSVNFYLSVDLLPSRSSVKSENLFPFSYLSFYSLSFSVNEITFSSFCTSAFSSSSISTFYLSINSLSWTSKFFRICSSYPSKNSACVLFAFFQSATDSLALNSFFRSSFSRSSNFSTSYWLSTKLFCVSNKFCSLITTSPLSWLTNWSDLVRSACVFLEIASLSASKSSKSFVKWDYCSFKACYNLLTSALCYSLSRMRVSTTVWSSSFSLPVTISVCLLCRISLAEEGSFYLRG